MQNITLQVKIKQVNDQPPSSKIDLQQRDLKITSRRRQITIRVWDRTHRSYLQPKVQKYLDYRWIQQSIVQNPRSRKFKRAKYEQTHINHSYKILLIVCTSVKDVNLMSEDFEFFYIFIYFIITCNRYIFKMAIAHFGFLGCV